MSGKVLLPTVEVVVEFTADGTLTFVPYSLAGQRGQVRLEKMIEDAHQQWRDLLDVRQALLKTLAHPSHADFRKDQRVLVQLGHVGDDLVPCTLLSYNNDTSTGPDNWGNWDVRLDNGTQLQVRPSLLFPLPKATP